jgi:thiol:disulfide interchange protein DsbD
MYRSFTAVLLLLALMMGLGLNSQKVHAGTEKRLEVRLVADQSAWQPQKPLGLLIDVRHKPGWHTYFINPGEAGLGLKLKWTHNPGIIISELQWPIPEKKDLLGLVAYSYSGQSLYVLQLSTGPDFDSESAPSGQDSLKLRADLNFLVCADICVPETHQVTLELPRSDAPAATHQDLFAKARLALPQSQFIGSHYESGQKGILRLAIKTNQGEQRPSSVHIIPYDESVMSPTTPQTLYLGDEGVLIKTKSLSDLKGPVRALVMTNNGSFDVQFAPAKVGEGFANKGLARSKPSLSPLALAGIIAMAVVGGLILNLMPCVFPIISMKILALARINEDRAGGTTHALIYGAGVIVSFLGLALILEALKGLGYGLGWGFQLQNPYVTGFLALVMGLVGLSLWGGLKLGSSLQGLGSNLLPRLGPNMEAFFSGVLAVVVAAPCTAPFMATAIGVALAQGGLVALSIFLGLGVGFALPFVLFSLLVTLSPRFAQVLPRPGGWMVRLQKLLAIPMFLTGLWLLWVLSRQIDQAGLIIFGLALLVLITSLLIMRSRLGLFVLSALCLGIMVYGLSFAPPPQDKLAPLVRLDHVVFSQKALDELRAQKRPVFVDMTAAWCVTCKVNQELVIETPAMKKALDETKTVLMVGDWTHQDPEITAFLQSHGRSGVPLYVYYPPSAEPVVLEPMLSKDKTVRLIAAQGS